MIYPKKRIFVIFIGLVLIIGCKKKEDDDHHQSMGCIHRPRSFISDLDFFNCKYKTGSYWCFFDSINNSYDTLKLVKQEEYFGSIFFNRSECNDSIEMYKISLTGFYPQNNDIDSLEVYVEPKVVWCIGKTFGYPGMFYYKNPFIDNNNGLHDSLLINNNWYRDVYESDTIRCKDLPYHLKVTYKLKPYFNPEYGFLRTDIFDASNKLVAKKVIVSRNIVR